jgi:hypothetical protein
MRERKKFVEVTDKWSHGLLDTGQVIWQSDNKRYTKYESMIDSVERLTADIYPMKDIDHWKFTQNLTNERRTNAAANDTCNTFWHYPLWPFPVYNPVEVCSSLDSVERYYPRYAGILQEILPSLDAPFDLVVVVAEFKELLDLAKGFRKLVSALSKIPKNFREASQMFASDKKKSLTQMWAEHHLQRNFALKPAIADAYNLVESFLTLGDRLYTLRVGAGADKVHKAHGGFRDRPDVGEVWRQELALCGGSCSRSKEASCTLYDSFHEIKGGVTVLYSYTLPNDFDKFWGMYSAALQTLGGSVSLRTGWDLIPFSFVADWIFPIGDMLGEYKMDAFPVKISILDMCVSLRVRRRGLIKNKMFCYTQDREVPTGTVYAERYTRKAFRNALPSIFTANLPSYYQVSLGAALAVSLGQDSLTGFFENLTKIKKARRAISS